MAIWAIGDIQGCANEFERLLTAIDFRPRSDQLVLVGDLVNRGPDSLGVLRRARELEPTVVLGNHDLHLLALAAGVRSLRRGDTLDAILSAPDASILLKWLRQQPVIAYAEGWRVVHAGLDPRWETNDIDRWNKKVRRRLSGDAYRDLLVEAFGPQDQQGRTARALNLMTRIRMVDADGEPDFSYSGPPTADDDRVPWFEVRRRSTPTVFGHWAALGFSRGPDWMGIDTGCVWGNQLTAVNLKSGDRVSVPSEFTAAG
jgi:bis(5'-nucleosyl)-tetraphosphatase (symmetrical)